VFQSASTPNLSLIHAAVRTLSRSACFTSMTPIGAVARRMSRCDNSSGVSTFAISFWLPESLIR
jgi:hypothetical protein